MRVAGIQHDIVWEDGASTRAHIAPLVASAVSDGAELVLLPEMFATGFSMHTERIAEAPDGPTTEFLRTAAADHRCWIGGTVALHTDDARATNSFVLAGPNGELHRYDKMHPFTHAGEHEHYAAGSGPVVVTVAGLRIALFVCYDLRFADDFWDLAPSVDCYLVPANWPRVRREHWNTLLRARAIENQAWVVGVNRVGRVGSLEYSGDSAIIDPFGAVVASAPGPADDGVGPEAIVLAEVDPGRVAAIRGEYPFLTDRTRR